MAPVNNDHTHESMVVSARPEFTPPDHVMFRGERLGLLSHPTDSKVYGTMTGKRIAVSDSHFAVMNGNETIKRRFWYAASLAHGFSRLQAWLDKDAREWRRQCVVETRIAPPRYVYEASSESSCTDGNEYAPRRKCTTLISDGGVELVPYKLGAVPLVPTLRPSAVSDMAKELSKMMAERSEREAAAMITANDEDFAIRWPVEVASGTEVTFDEPGTYELKFTDYKQLVCEMPKCQDEKPEQCNECGEAFDAYRRNVGEPDYAVCSNCQERDDVHDAEASRRFEGEPKRMVYDEPPATPLKMSSAAEWHNRNTSVDATAGWEE